MKDESFGVAGEDRVPEGRVGGGMNGALSELRRFARGVEGGEELLDEMIEDGQAQGEKGETHQGRSEA